MKGFDAFIYSDNYKNLEFYGGFDIVNLKDETQKSNYVFLSFDKGKLKRIIKNGYPNIDEIDLSGKSKEEIIKALGKPNKQIYCNQKNIIMSYSDRGNGNVDVKMPKYYVKNVVLNDKNIAIKMIDTVNNDLNKNRFACQD